MRPIALHATDAALSGGLWPVAIREYRTSGRALSSNWKALSSKGEAESGCARLTVEKFALLSGKRPVLGDLIRIPILLHGAFSKKRRLFVELA